MYKPKHMIYDDKGDESGKTSESWETVHVDVGTDATMLLSDTKYHCPHCELT